MLKPFISIDDQAAVLSHIAGLLPDSYKFTCLDEEYRLQHVNIPEHKEHPRINVHCYQWGSYAEYAYYVINDFLIVFVDNGGITLTNTGGRK